MILEIMVDVTNTSYDPAVLNLLTTMLGIFAAFMIFYIALTMFTCYGLFKKANVKPTSAFIPIYNMIVLLKVCELSPMLLLLFFIPGVSIVFVIILFYKLNKLYSGTSLTLLGLIFLPFIFLPIFATVDKYKYKKAVDLEEASVVSEMPTLARQEEIDALNNIEEETQKPDSIFKSDIEMIEDVEPYKATGVAKAEIEVKEEVKEQNENKQPDLLKKEEDFTIEIVDLSK